MVAVLAIFLTRKTKEATPKAADAAIRMAARLQG